MLIEEINIESHLKINENDDLISFIFFFKSHSICDEPNSSWRMLRCLLLDSTSYLCLFLSASVISSSEFEPPCSECVFCVYLCVPKGK